jgi:squalene cyclase
VISVCDPALDHLLKSRTEAGVWREAFDLSAITAAAYLVMLRTSGLIGEPGARHEELELVRRLIQQRNPDGGFYPSVGSRSSRAVTRLVLTALRLARGEVSAAGRPSQWFERNPDIDSSFARETDQAVHACVNFLGGSGRRDRRFELHFSIPTAILGSYADPVRNRPHGLPVTPNLMGALCQMGRRNLTSPFSDLVRTILPTVLVLHTASVDQWRRTHGRSNRRDSDVIGGPLGGKWLDDVISTIIARQNQRGDWFYCTPYTVMNVMALRWFGLQVDHPAIQRAYRFLRQSLYRHEDGGLFPSLMNSDIWDTSVAVYAYLSVRGRTARDSNIIPALEFLLENQGQHGGYGWGSGSLNDCDADSTAGVLRALSIAVKSAPSRIAREIEPAMARCRGYLQPRQTRQGGFCAWSPSELTARPGPIGPVKGALFDVSSADLTARVVAALLHSGSTVKDLPILKGLKYLARLQSADGGWWSRWWTGYISGTAFVLDALAASGFRWTRARRSSDAVGAGLTSCMERGVNFLCGRQNIDGGWGETVRADIEESWAGRGPSRAIQTGAAIVGMLSCGYPAGSLEVRRGVEWLLAARDSDGLWHDDHVGFTILPGELYYSHPMYSKTIPLAALATFVRESHA